MDNQFFTQQSTPVQPTAPTMWNKGKSITGLIFGAVSIYLCLNALVCYNTEFIALITEMMDLDGMGSVFFSTVGSISAFVCALIALPFAIVGFVLSLKNSKAATEAGVSSGIALAAKIVGIIGFALTLTMVFISFCVMIPSCIDFVAYMERQTSSSSSSSYYSGYPYYYYYY